MKNIFFSFFLLSAFTIFSEENESLELLYKKIEVLEEEIRDLRNILEENSILVDRSLELQQQRYLDLDSRILEISKISSEKLNSIYKEGQYLDTEEKELFKSALILFEESRFAEALEIFSQIIITFPNGAFTADAYFWSGELFLAQEMYEDAKLSFKNVVDNFYQHSRAPDSLFKLGEIYRIEGDIERSLGFYDKVNEDFPDSGASQLSKKSQENLKEESNLVE